MGAWLAGWVGEWMDWWMMDEWLHGGGWMDVWMGAGLADWMDGWVGEWMDGISYDISILVLPFILPSFPSLLLLTSLHVPFKKHTTDSKIMGATHSSTDLKSWLSICHQ